MISLKSIIDTRKTNRSQVLADFITRTADYKLDSAFKFVTNLRVMDESGSYIMSLYRDQLSEKAISVNWTESDEFASISYWRDYAGSPTKPDKEAIFEDTTIDKMKPIVEAVFDRLAKCYDNKKYAADMIISEGKEFTEEIYSDILTEADDGFNFSFKPVKQAKQATPAAKPAEETKAAAVKPAKNTNVTEPPPEYWADPDTIFADVESSVKSLCGEQSGFKAVLITGAGGLGKSHHVEKAFNEAGMVFNEDWFKESGKTSAKAVFLALLEHYDKIIVFDDCDDALTNKNVANLFKAALDTKEHRFVTWSTSDTLDTAGLPNEIIKNLVKNDKKHRLPSTFEFTGSIVFITNLPVRKVDSALLTRCDVIDVKLKTEDISKIMRARISGVKVPASNRVTGATVDLAAGKDALKNEVLEFILSDEYMAHIKKYNMNLNWRLFQKAFTFACMDPSAWRRRMWNTFHS